MERKQQCDSGTAAGSQQPLKALGKALIRLVRDTRAQDQVEYAVMIGVISLVAAMSLPAIADRVSAVFTQTAAVLEGNPVTPGSPASPTPPSSPTNCGNPNPGTFQGRSPCAP